MSSSSARFTQPRSTALKKTKIQRAKEARYRGTTACFGLSTAFGLEAYLRTMVLVGVPVP